MKRLLLTLVTLIAIPSSATVTKISWEGSVDRGGNSSTPVSGNFLYDNSKPTFDSGEGRMLHEGSIRSVNLFIGNDHYASDFPWFSTVEPIPSFSELAKLDGPGPETNSFSWARDSWWFAVNEGDNNWREIGGKVVSFWTDGGYVPEIPGNDAEPVPEPSSMVLVATGLVAAFVFKKGRTLRRLIS